MTKGLVLDMTVNDKHVTLGGLESSVNRAVSESKAYTDEQLNAEGIEAALAQISGDISGLGDKIKNITITGAQASDALPLAAADEASAGTSNEFSRADHVHPKVGNADNLGGQPASYYASNETVNNIIDGTTVVKKAQTATLAETATKAESADNATMLGGVPATNYAQTVVVEKIIQGETDVANSTHADTATKLDTARAITLSGDVSGSTTFDGTTNVDIEVEIADDSHNHIISNVDGLQAALDAKATNDALTALSTKVNAILSADGVVEKANKLTTARTVSISGDVTGSTTFDGSANVDIKATVVGGVPIAASATPKANGTAAVGTSAKYAREDHVHPAQTTVSGNAGSATKLATARKIGSASFNGTANITLAQMGVESFVNSRHGSITLATSDTWTADGSNYYVTKTISGLLATDRIDIATDYATLITLDNPIMAVNVNGVCRIYCKAKPSKAITLQYTLIRQSA